MKRFFGGDAPSRARSALVDALVAAGLVTQPAVESALRTVPRHLFLPDVPPETAYRDIAIVTKRENNVPVSSSSQPAIMAIMLQQLDLQPGHHVLEIGAGTGYNAALMADIVGPEGRVITMDIDEDTVEGARRGLERAGVPGVDVILGDGSLGYPEGALYDRIILAVGAGEVLPTWWDQLNSSGRLVLPLSVRGPQVSVAFDREETYLISRSVYDCGFMRLRGPAAEQESSYSLASDSVLTLAEPSATHFDLERTLGWIAGPSRDWDLDVIVSSRDLSRCRLWLSLRDPRTCEILAGDQFVHNHVIPRIARERESPHAASSIGLIDDQGLALLGLISGSRSGPVIRAFGQGDTLTEDLLAHLQAWADAHYPSTEQLVIRVYRPGTTPPTEQGYRLRGRVSEMLVTWR